MILAGVGTVEACRILGIGRKTRLSVASRARRCCADSSGRDGPVWPLSLAARAAAHRDAATTRARSPNNSGEIPRRSSRELRRNVRPHDVSYDGDLAHSRSRERARRPRRGRLLVDTDLRALVQAKLELEWSPEQIAAWLRRTYPEQPPASVHDGTWKTSETPTKSSSPLRTKHTPNASPAASRPHPSYPSGPGSTGPRPRSKITETYPQNLHSDVSIDLTRSCAAESAVRPSGGGRPPPRAPSQRAERSWRQPDPGGAGQGKSSRDKAGTVQHRQMDRVRRARCRGVREKPMFTSRNGPSVLR